MKPRTTRRITVDLKHASDQAKAVKAFLRAAKAGEDTSEALARVKALEAEKLLAEYWPPKTVEETQGEPAEGIQEGPANTPPVKRARKSAKPAEAPALKPAYQAYIDRAATDEQKDALRKLFGENMPASVTVTKAEAILKNANSDR